MLTLSVLRFSTCDRFRACCVKTGPGVNGRDGSLRTSVRARGSPGDDSPTLAFHKVEGDGYIEYFFYDVDQLDSISDVHELQTAIRSSGTKPLLLCFHSQSCDVSRQLLETLACKHESGTLAAQMRVATINIDDPGVKLATIEFR